MRWGTSLRIAWPRLLEMTMGQRFHAGGWRAFKVEVALEDIADQFVAAPGPNGRRRAETDQRRRNPVQMIISQPVVNDEVRTLDNLWLDVLNPKLDSGSRGIGRRAQERNVRLKAQACELGSQRAIVVQHRHRVSDHACTQRVRLDPGNDRMVLP